MVSTSVYYPPPCFSFAVSVGSDKAAAQSAADASFQEVSGLDARIEVEPYQEGGENRYMHQLPKTTRFSNLVLKRGYVVSSSYLAEWTAGTVGSTFAAGIETNTLVITLLGPDHQPLVVWNIDRAWPVRWEAGPLDAQKNEILTETMEFSYATMTRSLPAGGGASRS
ncbi:phage tail protein [Niveispirillum sp. KHB5.9]|uniref:phage tail protein n=1 Tax=Niveispirillum sp. KHB5.9 TaxID=3400269 RepID=UPI003A88504E